MGRARKGTVESEKLIDFRELRETAEGEELEGLTEHILRGRGYDTTRVGRGPDGGRDLLCAEILASEFVAQSRRWLVQCKHLAKSGRAVGEKDIGSPTELCVKHDASGYLLVTTTVATSEVVKLFEKLTAAKEHSLAAGIWDEHRLRELLLDPKLRDVLKRFLPQSFARVEALEPEEILVRKLRDKGISEEHERKIQGVIREALDAAARVGRLEKLRLTSMDIYPAATTFRYQIERICTAFLDDDLEVAAEQMEVLPFEEWTATVAGVARHDKDRAERLLVTVAANAGAENQRFAAVRRLVQEWQKELSDVLPFVRALDAESLSVLLTDTGTDHLVAQNVKSEVMDRNPDDLDDLPPHGIDDVTIESIDYQAGEGGVSASVEFSVDVSYGGEGEGLGGTFPGTAEVTIQGFRDVSVDSLHVDATSFFE